MVFLGLFGFNTVLIGFDMVLIGFNMVLVGSSAVKVLKWKIQSWIAFYSTIFVSY